MEMIGGDVREKREYVRIGEIRPYREPVQPDRIECGTRRYYPIRYELIYQGLCFVCLAAILGLGLAVISLW